MKLFSLQTSTFIFIAFLIIGCTHSSAPYLQPSSLNSTFDFDTNQSFEEYVKHEKNKIQRARIFVDPNHKEKETQINAPFIFYPDSKKCTKTTAGALLTHGLFASPSTMKSIGRHLQKKCMLVYGVLLTGHGTRPGDLKNVQLSSWKKQISYAVNQLQKKTSNVYLVGFSTGGGLNIDYALNAPNPKILKGLINIAPSASKEKLGFLAKILNSVFNIWFKKYPPENALFYQSMELNSMSQVHTLTKHIKKKIHTPAFNFPALNIMLFEDETVNASSNINLLLKNKNKNNQFIIHHAHDLPDNFKNLPKTLYLPSKNLAYNVKILSHLSLHNGSNNPLYGLNSPYPFCSHYPYKEEKYKMCKNKQGVYAQTGKKWLEKYDVVQRATFNPHFPIVLEKINTFISSTLP